MSLYSPILGIFEQTYKGTRKGSYSTLTTERNGTMAGRVLAQMHVLEGHLQGVCYYVSF